MIGAQAVAKAAPDGYTLLMAIDSTLAMNQFMYRNLPYDPLTDFEPVTLVAKTMILMMVHTSSDMKSVKDVIDKAKASPGKLNYGAGTLATKLMGFLMKRTIGIDTVLVPYNGSAEVTQGLLTKSVDFTYDGTSAAMASIQGGQFRVLAKFDSRPFPLAPDAPSFMQAAGRPDFDEINVWLGLVAPKGTPAAIISKLQAEVVRVLDDPLVKERSDAAGLFAATSTPAEFAAFIRKEAERWKPVVQDSGMRFD